jgi:type VI secretion system protein ImpK
LVDQLRVGDVEYETIASTYNRLIQTAQDAAKSAGIPKKQFDKVLFPVFAWIDETILDTGWAARADWVNNSLQKRFFNTTNAGNEFFQRLEKLKPDDRDLLEIYDYCLASGFKGRYFESYHQEELEGIRKNTCKLLWGQDVSELPEVLFPDAGDTLLLKRIKRKRWKGLSSFASVFVLLPILLFLALYYFFTGQLNQVLTNIGF